MDFYSLFSIPGVADLHRGGGQNLADLVLLLLSRFTVVTLANLDGRFWILALFYTSCLDICTCFTCDGSSTIQLFPLAFYTWYLKQVTASLSYIKVYFKKTLIALKLKYF
jgi:hypothetical protein